MSKMAIDVPPDIYKRLEEQARKAGKDPHQYTRELIEGALEAREGGRPRTAREVLQATGRVRPLSDALRRRIIPDVTLDEVREVLSQADGPSLSEIILEQRGPRP